METFSQVVGVVTLFVVAVFILGYLAYTIDAFFSDKKTVISTKIAMCNLFAKICFIILAIIFLVMFHNKKFDSGYMLSLNHVELRGIGIGANDDGWSIGKVPSWNTQDAQDGYDTPKKY